MLFKNALVIGSGHYVLGVDKDATRPTDKDLGVLVPSLLGAVKKGLIENIFLHSKDLTLLSEKLRRYRRDIPEEFGNALKIALPFEGEDCSEETWRDLPGKFSPDETAVFVVVPDRFHYRMLMEFVRCGFSIFVVKPMCLELCEFDSLQEAYLDSDAMIYVDYHKVFDPQNVLFKSRYISGQFGLPMHIYSVQTQRKVMKEIYSSELASNPNFCVGDYLASHYIHQVSHFFNAKPSRVFATGQAISERVANDIIVPNKFDMVQYSVRWTVGDYEFDSYHEAGWCDENCQPMMTRQRFNFRGSKGVVEMNQDARGVEIFGPGQFERPNPSFFQLVGLSDRDVGYLHCDISSFYGSYSVLFFLEQARKVRAKAHYRDVYERHPNSIAMQRSVTTVLEACKKSLLSNELIYL